MAAMYDVAIIGAGPAGTTLARLVGEYCRVLLLERRPLDEPPRADAPGKPCGGLIAPDAQKALAALETPLPKSLLTETQLFAVRAVDLPSGLGRYYPRHYLNIDREKFDRWLLSLVGANAAFRARCVVRHFEDAGGHFRLSGVAGGTPFTERARIVIGADGAASLVRRLAAALRPRGTGAPPMPKRYIAVQEWFEADRPTACFWAIFDPDITDFYSWAIPKDGRLVVGAALAPGREARGRFERLKDKLGRLGFRLDRPVRRHAA